MKTTHISDKLSVVTQSDFLTPDECESLFAKIVSNPIHFRHAPLTKKGVPSKKRNKTIYGSLSVYRYEYRGKLIETPIHSWSDSFKELEEIAKRIETKTGQSYNTCVIQIYNTGIVEIKPHRDKEMKPGSIIASVSLGATRIMRFDKCNKSSPSLDIPLTSGMLCLINPPTNDYWLHSIPAAVASKEMRISLVFRNF